MKFKLGTVLALCWAFSLPVFATPGEVEVGGHLREAPLQGLGGRSGAIADYRGKPMIINVWASWCGPCRNEMGSLNRLARRYGGKKFNVIGISTDDDGKAALAFIRKTGVAFPNYLDSNAFMEDMLGASTIPLTVLVDANGQVLAKVHGFREWDSPETVAAIAEAFHIRM